MLCRLCLINLEENSGVSLFDYNGEWEITKMIAKFLHLELSKGDTVSEIICNDCWMHLDDFQKFSKYVEDKQNTLNKELEVKSVAEFIDTGASAAACVALTVDFSSNQTEEQVTDNNEESLLDIKDVLLTQKTEVSPHIMQDEEFSYANDLANDIGEQVHTSSGDDDVPLKTILKRKTKSLSITLRKKSKEPQKSATKQSPIKIRVKKKLKTEKTLHAKSMANKETTTTDNVANALALDNSNAKEPSKYTKDLLKSDEFISKNMELKCDMCELILESYTQLKIHFRSVHDCNGYVRCCGKRITKRIVLVDHIQYHLNPQHFKCPKCNKVFAARNSYMSHMSRVHPAVDELKFACEICSKKFTKQYLLDIHLKQHSTNKQQHICKICQKGFTTFYYLKMHIQKLHENVSCHICNYCGRKFRCKTTFKQHIADHEGVVINPPVQCSICKNWLINKYKLKQHMKAHNPINIECKECGHVCATQKVLMEHTNRVHNNTHSYECTFCGKTFQKPISLKEHMGIHTGEKAYNCSHCSLTFRAKSNMYKHIKKIHTTEWLASRNARSMALEKIAKTINNQSDHTKLG